MRRVVFDIETMGAPLESFDEEQQDYLTRFAKTEEERADAILKLSLYPMTAQIVAIGMHNPDSERGQVIYQADEPIDETNAEGTLRYVTGSEQELLQRFWEDIQKYDQFITFNGRSFDCPFLMLRSAIHGIRPSRNLMPYRYDYKEHCDLLEQLTYYGAFKKFNLDFYCKSFGIHSPKSEGITGLDIGPLFTAKRFRDIADYCYRDVVATGQLFRIWEKTLKF